MIVMEIMFKHIGCPTVIMMIGMFMFLIWGMPIMKGGLSILQKQIICDYSGMQQVGHMTQ